MASGQRYNDDDDVCVPDQINVERGHNTNEIGAWNIFFVRKSNDMGLRSLPLFIFVLNNGEIKM